MRSSSRPPHSRYRFGFKRKRSEAKPQAATTDEILDSLTRQARSMEENREERTLGLQTIFETEPSEEPLQPSPLDSGPTFGRLKTRFLGKSVFTAMLVSGLAFLWIYSRLSQTLNLKNVDTVQEAVSRAGFGDWQKVVLIALSAVTIALLARRSRNKVRSSLFC